MGENYGRARHTFIEPNWRKLFGKLIRICNARTRYLDRLQLQLCYVLPMSIIYVKFFSSPGSSQIPPVRSHTKGFRFPLS